MGQAESQHAEPEVEEQEPLNSEEEGEEEGEQGPSALVIVGPSGVGKGTLIAKLMEGRDDFGFSCSHTTRQPREGEKDGVHYHFIAKEEFEKGIAEGEFLEHAYVHDNIYGTSLAAVEAVAAAGKCCVLDIDVQGARQVRKSGLPAIFVFIAPPSMEELERRLRGRGTEAAEQVETRLKNAHQEMASLEEKGLYDVVITNSTLEEALEELRAVAARALAGEVGGPLTDPPAPPPAAVSARAVADALPSPAATPKASAGAEASSGKDGVLSGTSPATAATATAPAAGTPRAPAPADKVVTQSKAEAAVVPEKQQEEEPTTSAPATGLDPWRSKVVIVTGAASGIGRALSVELAKAGVRVVAVSRRKAALEALQSNVVQAGVPIAEFLPVVCDVTKEAEVVALPRIIAKRWPGSGVAGVVNAAAVVRGGASLLDGSTASWVEMASTNVLGVAMVTREAVQDMARHGTYGHVINICCLDGHVIEAGESNGFYSATKHAVRAMTEGLRQEARARGIPLRVTCISPGLVDTPFQQGRSFGSPTSSESSGATAGAAEPVQLKEEDVVRAVVWCMSAPDHVDINDMVLRAMPGPAGTK